MPFTLIARFLGNADATASAHSDVTAGQYGRARWIGAATGIAAGRTPWRSLCFPQALACAVQLRLARIPHAVDFGLRRHDGALLAHAWVTVGDDVVLGGDPSPYAVVGSFAWRPVPIDRKVRGHVRLLRDHAPQRDRAA